MTTSRAPARGERTPDGRAAGTPSEDRVPAVVRSRPASRRNRLLLRTRVLLLLVELLPNAIGAGVVLVIAAWILPLDKEARGDELLVNLLVFVGYLVLALATGAWVGHLITRSRPGRGDDQLRRIVLRAPLRLSTLQGTLWAIAAVVFFLINVGYSWRIGLQVIGTVLIGAITTVSITFRLVERVLRSEVEYVFATNPVPRRRGIPGVVLRTLGGWLFGTAAPLLGIMLAAIGALVFGNYDLTRLAVVVLVLGGVALLFGGTVITLTATSTAAPVLAVRRALRRVEEGRFDTDVRVFDTSELGQLQNGFNTMVAGLRERERVRDLFGRHVGEDVARHALENEVELGGETREVAVVFVDLIGSTGLAASRPPAEVVEVLNTFFAIVIDVVEAHQGWINKFEGDAALAVFGAPSQLDDAAGLALATARTLARRLDKQMFASSDLELGAGIGVSAGAAVAGNIGDRRRYEYTVIGDPVNEAARLSDLAKTLDGRVAASGAALERAADAERAHWHADGPQRLRGRSHDTEVHVPAG